LKKSLYKLLAGYVFAFTGALFLGVIVLNISQAEINFTAALRLSVSALTLTGGDFSSQLADFSFSTQIIVLFLIQAGAFFWLAFVLQLANILGLSHLFSNKKQKLSASGIIAKAAGYLLLLEAFSAIVIYAFTRNLPDVTQGNENYFYGVFHGVSVFCNSGFTLMDGNFSNASTNRAYIFQLVIMCIILLGSLGYAAFFDLTSIYRLRQRMLNPEINWTKQTRLAIYGIAASVLVASLVFYFSEANYFLYPLKIVEAGITVVFNSAAWFGSGFYAVKPVIFTTGLQWFIVLCMLLGSASGAFGVLGLGVYFYALKNLAGSKNPYKVLAKNALYVLIYTFAILFLAVIILSFFYREETLQAHIFNAVSAFTNNGLSISAIDKEYLQSPVFYLLMLLGRIGIPAVLILSLQKSIKQVENLTAADVMLI
jgi:Trk-type K+ transport system membrane component